MDHYEITDLFTLKISLPETLWDVPSHCYQSQIKYVEQRKTTQVSTRVIDRRFYNKIRNAIDIAVI